MYEKESRKETLTEGRGAIFKEGSQEWPKEKVVFEKT